MTTLAPRTRTIAAPTVPARPGGAPRSAHRALACAAATAVIWLTSLFIVALWVSGGGITSTLGFTAETLTTLGRLTGLVAANLLLYQVLLMARIPLFERGFGRDSITRMHRFVGFWSFWLMGAHIVLLVLGYAATAAINPFVQIWEFVWDYPGMLLATVGTLLILLVVVTSIRRARRKLRYESGTCCTSTPTSASDWRCRTSSGPARISPLPPGHRVLVGAVGPGCAHPSSSSASACPSRVRSATASASRGWSAHGDNGVTVRMSGRDLHALGARAGQFFIWRFVDGAGWTRGHPFSLSGAPGPRGLSISARIAGDGTQRLTRLRPGTEVLIEGPYGHMTGTARRGTKLLMIGAGAGVAPLVSLLEEQPPTRPERPHC